MPQHPPRRHPVPPPPNYVADELRRILVEFDGDPNSCHLDPAVRERLLGLTEHVEQVAAEPVQVDASTELTATFGLEPEQEIRAKALDVASYVIGDVSGTVNGVADHLIDLAEPLVDWIRDGNRPLSCYRPVLDETRSGSRP